MKSRPRLRRRLHPSRRTFLKLTAVCGAASLRLPRYPTIASCLPLEERHHFLPEPEALLASSWSGFDLLLVPAYVAGALIRRARLQPLPGPPGRAHDPEGAFTQPERYCVGALFLPRRALALPGRDWHRRAAWPASMRLVIGAALRRRGYSPNDLHPGHLAEIRADLLALRSRLTADPVRAVRRGAVDFAYAPLSLSAGGAPLSPPDLAVHLLPEGNLLVEYDWVIPLDAPDPDAARAFLAGRPAPSTPGSSPRRPLIPLAPLPDSAHAHYARLWAAL